MKQTFSEWLRKVDTALVKRVGRGDNCLGDFCYRDAYDNGERPVSVAKQVLINEGWEG